LSSVRKLEHRAEGCKRDVANAGATLIAAGVVLRRHQNQARAGRDWLGSRGLPEGAQDAEDCDISGENSEADGSDYGQAEDDRHKKRNHGLNPSIFMSC